MTRNKRGLHLSRRLSRCRLWSRLQTLPSRGFCGLWGFGHNRAWRDAEQFRLETVGLKHLLFFFPISHTLTCWGPRGCRCHLCWHWWGCCKVCTQTGWWPPLCVRTGEPEIPPPSLTAIGRHSRGHTGLNSRMWLYCHFLQKAPLIKLQHDFQNSTNRLLL